MQSRVLAGRWRSHFYSVVVYAQISKHFQKKTDHKSVLTPFPKWTRNLCICQRGNFECTTCMQNILYLPWRKIPKMQYEAIRLRGPLYVQLIIQPNLPSVSTGYRLEVSPGRIRELQLETQPFIESEGSDKLSVQMVRSNVWFNRLGHYVELVNCTISEPHVRLADQAQSFINVAWRSIRPSPQFGRLDDLVSYLSSEVINCAGLEVDPSLTQIIMSSNLLEFDPTQRPHINRRISIYNVSKLHIILVIIVLNVGSLHTLGVGVG